MRPTPTISEADKARAAAALQSLGKKIERQVSLDAVQAWQLVEARRRCHAAADGDAAVSRELLLQAITFIERLMK